MKSKTRKRTETKKRIVNNISNMSRITSSKKSKSLKLFQNNQNKNFLNIFFESANLDILAKKFRENIGLFYQKEKFQKYYQNYHPFGDIRGKSGAVIGTFKNNNNYVMKLYFSKDKITSYNLVKHNDCLQVDFKVNELLVNLLLTNLELLPNFTKKDLRTVYPHLLPQIDGGIEENYIYLISPKIGLNYQIDNHNYYITNLRDILFYNHLGCLKKWIENDNQEMIELYDQFMSLQFDKYLTAVSVLQNRISLLTTDMKMTNIFVKKTIQRSRKWAQLRNDGCLIDFILLITDLDKARYKIGNYHILPIDHKPYSNIIAKKMGLGLTLSMRYNCQANTFKESCPPITHNDFELLFMIVDMYVIYNHLGYNLKRFHHLKRILLDYLTISRSDFNKLLEIISSKNLRYNKNFTYYINKIILELCQFLKKNNSK